MTNNLYAAQDGLFERNFFLLLILSIVLHACVFIGASFLPGFLGGDQSKVLPYDVLTVKLLGSLEPPAPAAPPAPVDPNLKGPDVVELPQSDLIIPQPTPLERMITPVMPTDVIPIGERPPDQPPPDPVKKNEEPPPKVTLPDKVPEVKPKPKPQPKRPNNDAAINKSIEELRRKKEADLLDEQINSSIGNIARQRTQGDGTSSNANSGSPDGTRIAPEKEAYYLQIRAIIRSNWFPPPLALSPDLKCTFVIVVEPNGRIAGIRLMRPSGSPEYDQSVQQAISRSSLPGLPAAFEGRSDNPSFEFSYSYLNTAG
ncbi:MAG: TonB C-terminal domain-containing protein [Deltaproteobacteria bacterium]|jgi:protein TonB|nr:TonB C-terminal domain-containing protein [Deltaproteobacteria bacterium]